MPDEGQHEKGGKWTCRDATGVLTAEGKFVRGDPRGRWTVRSGAKLRRVTDPSFMPDMGLAY